MGGKADIVEQALKLVMGAGEEAAPTIRAYHVSPHDFDKFEPSKFRGSTFFSSTPERAKRGAEAGRNEMVFETSTDLPPANWKTYEVEIDPSRIKGLALTPDEHQWFHKLPNKIVGDEALAEAVKGIPHGMYWDDFYNHSPVAPNIFEYTKKNNPPSMSYEDAIKTGRDVYHRQWPHYNSTATDERAAAESTQNNNMGGYLVNDEGGLSFAIHDPSIIKILNKYSEGGSIREGYQTKGRTTKGDGGELDSETYDPEVDDAVRTAKSVLPSDGSYVENRPSKWERTKQALWESNLNSPVRGFYNLMHTSPEVLLGGGTPEQQEAVAGASWDAAQGAMAGSMPFPVPENSLRVFGGVKSKTADLNALEQARLLERDNATAQEIWDKTGWFKGADNQWRYEIPDVGTKVYPSTFTSKMSSSGQPYKATTLSTYFKHPELFEAYPEFKDMPVNETFASGVNGYYSPRYEAGTITPKIMDPFIGLNLKSVPTAGTQRSTLLHEIQHAIQQKEGFAPGASPKIYPDQTPNPMVGVYEKQSKTDPDLVFVNTVRETPEYREQLANSSKFFTEHFNPHFKKLLKEEEETGADLTSKFSELTKEYEQLEAKMFPLVGQVTEAYKSLAKRGIMTKKPKEFLEPTEAYRATAGEVESRNVQERADMSRNGLKNIPPWETQEKYLPYEGQLIDWNDTSWRKGYTDGGFISDDADRDIESAMMIAGGR